MVNGIQTKVNEIETKVGRIETKVDSVKKDITVLGTLIQDIRKYLNRLTKMQNI